MDHSTVKGSMQGISSDRTVCDNCLFLFMDAESSTSHCFRFARFVDHVINESSRNCDYHQTGIA